MLGPRKEGEPAPIEIPESVPVIERVYSIWELEDKIRNTPLLNDSIYGLCPYRKSEIKLESISISKLHPSARYVLEQNLFFQKELRKALGSQNIDTLQMRKNAAAVRFYWGDHSSVITPPIIEVSPDDGGLYVITDGLHRVVLARMMGLKTINAMVIKNTSVPLSVMPVGWGEVKVVKRTPSLSEKRKLRFPDAKDAFRWFGMTSENLDRVVGGLSDPEEFGYKVFFRDLNFDKHLPKEGQELGDRVEFATTLSVAALVSDINSTHLLLVKKRRVGKWGLPAGALKWLEKEGRLETFDEGLVRELCEETGIQADNFRRKVCIDAIVNLPGSDKNRIGAIYKFGIDERADVEFTPGDEGEIESARFFSDNELTELLNADSEMIYKPEFNKGLIIWWLRNEHRDMWDPYRGTEPLDTVLDEKYLLKWSDKCPVSGVLYK